MKKLSYILLGCLISVMGAKAEVIFDETFDYPEADLEDVSAWSVVHEKAPTGSVLESSGKAISTPSLVYAPSDEYVLSGLGKKVAVKYTGVGSSDPTNDATNYRNRREFGAVTSGSIYLSFLFHSGTQSQQQSDVISFNNIPNTGNEQNGPRLWAGRIGGPGEGPEYMRFGVTTGSTTGGHIEWATEVKDINTVYFLVLKHDLDANVTSLYINPTIGGTEDGEVPATVTTTTNATSVNRSRVNNAGFRINQGNKADFEASGIRVSTTWAEAVAKKDGGTSSTPTINNDKEAVSVTYYTITGVVVDQPVSGVYIQETTYEDGSVETTKVIK